MRLLPPSNSGSASGLRALVLALSLASGIALWRHPAQAFWNIAPVVVGALVSLTFLRARFDPDRGLVGPGLDLLLPLLAGALAAGLHQTRDATPSLLRAWSAAGVHPFITPIALRVRLLDRQELPDHREAWIVRIDSYQAGGPIPRHAPSSPAVLARLTVTVAPNDPAGWRVGDRLDLTARLGPPRSFRNPGAFDYGRYLEARGVALAGTIKSSRLVRLAGRPRFDAGRCLMELREAIVASIVRACGGDARGTSRLLSALLLGEREEIDPDVERDLLRAGVYHIVALSGLNVAVIVALGALLARLLPSSPRVRRLGLLLVIVGYWGLVRHSGSIARATLMAIVHLCGGLCRRRLSALGACAIAATLILICAPAAIDDGGFQLSMAATLGLILSGWRAPRRAAGRRIWMHRVAGCLLSSLRVSAAASLATTLLGAHHFHRITPIALVANLIAVPLANLLFGLALAVAMTAPINRDLAAGFADAASVFGAVLAWSMRRLAELPGASFHVVPPSAFVVIAGFSLVLLAGLAPRPWLRTAGLVFTLASIASAGGVRWHPRHARLEVTALDVGQGDALLVRLPGGQTILVDTGGFGRGDFDVGEKVVAPALRSLGILHLDLLAITHAHRDHLGGALAILEEFHPETLWLGRMPPHRPEVEAVVQAARRLRIPVVLPLRGVSIPLGGARIEVLNPASGASEPGPAANDDSLVLRIGFGTRAALLTGDLEAPVESILVREGRNVRSELLKVGHHGSRTSSSGPFLERVGPSLALISAGAGNPWGHPNPETLDRLSRLPAAILRTDRDGAIRCRTDGIGPWRCDRLDSR